MLLVFAFALLPSLGRTAAAAGPASPVRDINTSAAGSISLWPWGNDSLAIGGTIYFSASDGITGTELWATDGTARGTHRVKDICPGACSSGPQWMTAMGSELFFAADDGAHGRELWKSDGTEAGTVLVADLAPGLGSSNPTIFGALGSLLLFAADDGVAGRELWKTDGTAAGTLFLADINPGAPGSSPAPLAAIGTNFYFGADDGIHGVELWKTDGTPGGTGLIKDINPGSDSSISGSSPLLGINGAAPLAGKLLFAATDGTSGYELWSSDGTNAGTVLLKDILPGSGDSQPLDFVTVGAQVFFSALDGNGRELWKSDGSPGGTAIVADIYPGPTGSNPYELTAVGSQLYFRAADGTHGFELWKSDGSPGGTTIVADINPGAGDGLSSFVLHGMTALGGKLAFFASDGVHGVEPWVSDGTPGGTTLLADLNSGSADSDIFFFFGITRFAVANGKWLFPALSGQRILAYSSDGTPAGTAVLAEINTQTSAFDIAAFGQVGGTRPLADLGGTLLFRADDGATGAELWKSDGTAAGTVQVADLATGSAASYPNWLTTVGGAVFFNAQSGAAQGELWKSDGTPGGTTLLASLGPAIPNGSNSTPDGLTALGGTLFFEGDDLTVHRSELWKSDGTPMGTGLLKDIYPGTNSSAPAGLIPFGSLLLFRATDALGEELWRSDGTDTGTTRVLDIQAGSGSSSPYSLTVAGGLAFFSAEDGTSGRELWATDGTGVGTHRIKDIRPGAGSGLPYFNDSGSLDESQFAVLGTTVFFAADDGIAGEELWKSDGTDVGTVLVKDIFPGARPSEIHGLTAAFDRIYFVADDGVHGRELWVSDGTDPGTHLVADLLPGAGSSLPGELHAVGKRIVFSAYDGVHGRELWKSNGTAAGTVLLQDIAVGTESSSPQAFTESGGSLYFVADDGTSGFELWSLPRAAVDGALDFYTVAPCRVFDTRSGARMTSGIVRTFAVAGSCGIPSTARAVVGNLAVVQPGGQGYLTVYPTGGAIPMTSAVNVNSGKTRTNNAVLTLAPGGIDAFFTLTGGASADLVFDVVGYFE
jgi:ELWxxDGT repeat protein